MIDATGGGTFINMVKNTRQYDSRNSSRLVHEVKTNQVVIAKN